MLFERIQKVIAKELNLSKEEIQLDSVLTKDLDANSLDLINLITAFEEEFKIVIPEDDIRLFNTVKDIVDYLEELEKNKK